MRKIVKYVLVLLLGIMMLTPVKVEAASLSLSASRSSVEVGDTVTFTVSASNGAGRIDLSGAVNDSVFLDNSSQSFSVTATQAGTLTVTASGVLADYDTEADQSFSRSVSVKVNSPSSGGGGSSSGSSGNNGSTSNEETTPEETPEEETPKSTDNTLSSLSVDKGTLSPAFSSDVTDYTVDLTNSETEITISATANDSKASVSGTGLQPLKIGANSFAVDVTSESGSRRSYIVNVNVSETPTVFLEKDGNQMGILNNLEGVDIPKGFTETKVTINGQEVTALVNEEGRVTLLYMQNANGEKQFFIYDPNSSDYSIYNPIALCGLDLAVIDIPVDMQAKEGMTYGQVEVDGQTFYGWKFDDTGMENYTLLYLMDGSGTAHYYMHDSVLDNLQIYDNLAPLTAQKLNDMSYDLKVYTYCTYGFGAAAGILLLLMLFFAFKKKRHLAVAGTGMTTEPVKMAKPK